MLDKLHGVEEKYLDLEARLSDPDIVSDPAQYMKYARAHAALEEIVTVYREYKEKKILYEDDRPCRKTRRILSWRRWPGKRRRP